MTDKPRYQITSTPKGQTIRGLGPKISEQFEQEFEAAFGPVPSIIAQLRTPDGEPLHVEAESFADLLKRTGGQ